MAVASVIFAAGKGSRMVGFEGNKTLLPLVAGVSLYEGERPMLHEVLSSLPPGPRVIIVNHCAEEVRTATADFGVRYLEQPITNGTGGALLAARPFLESAVEESVIVTMGDVPLIRRQTYLKLLGELSGCDFVLLAFEPTERAQYGMIEIERERVVRIVEWKYWSKYPAARQEALRYCNAGVYAAKRPVLLHYMKQLAQRPHRVQKRRGDERVIIEEFFLTDLVEMMSADGVVVGMVTAPEGEVSGVDTPEMLARVQKTYRELLGSGRPFHGSPTEVLAR